MPFEKMKENLGRFFYTVRLHSLISKITSEQMERPEIVQLVEGEIENIEHQAQEWNYV